MERRRSWLGLLLCLMLTILVVYGFPRLATDLWASNVTLSEVPFTLLTDARAVNGYSSPESHLWLLTQLDQIDRVRSFVAPEAIAKLERVDYHRFAVVALLSGGNEALALDRITTQAGVITVYVQSRRDPDAQPASTSAYQLAQIPYSRASQVLRKLVLRNTRTLLPSSSPIPTPDTPQTESPVRSTVP